VPFLFTSLSCTKYQRAKARKAGDRENLNMASVPAFVIPQSYSTVPMRTCVCVCVGVYVCVV
jgi:hypothetical protein